jgi:hypothetical protein
MWLAIASVSTEAFNTSSAISILDKGALSFLDISSNDICKRRVGPKKVDTKASKGDLVEFNGTQGTLIATASEMHFGFVPRSDIQAIAIAIKDTRAFFSKDFVNKTEKIGNKFMFEDTEWTAVTEPDESGVFTAQAPKKQVRRLLLWQ